MLNLERNPSIRWSTTGAGWHAPPFEPAVRGACVSKALALCGLTGGLDGSQPVELGTDIRHPA